MADRVHFRSFLLLVLVVLAGLVVSGCGGRQLMPTPNIYIDSKLANFEQVPEEFQSNIVDVLYVTDRKPIEDSGGTVEYSRFRSQSLAFGSCEVEIGNDVSWQGLVADSTTQKRSKSLPMKIHSLKEEVRLPITPTPLVKTPQGVVEDPAIEARKKEILVDFYEVLQRRLAKTPKKEVFIFVHGYNNSFDESVFVIAEYWHFLGRQGVPIAYSWPAGGGMSFRGYAHDRESGEFTVYHLKQLIRVLAEYPQLEKIHLIAHSRGTHVLTSALRELFIEVRGARMDPRKVLKIGNVVLAAPDMDIDVTSQRVIAEKFYEGVGRLSVYVSSKDRALSMSDWLFEGHGRVGQLRLSDLNPQQKKRLEAVPRISIINARVKSNFTGHDYYRSNPAVSSDIILMLRDDLDPGASNGRPLTEEVENFWQISDNYPD